MKDPLFLTDNQEDFDLSVEEEYYQNISQLQESLTDYWETLDALGPSTYDEPEIIPKAENGLEVDESSDVCESKKRPLEYDTQTENYFDSPPLPIALKKYRVDEQPALQLSKKRAENELIVRNLSARTTQINKGSHWLPEEETFLVGLIFDKLFECGSLVSGAWEEIREEFAQAWTKHYGNQTNRTTCALLRHFKVLKRRQIEEGQKLFRRLHQLWENNFKSVKN